MSKYKFFIALVSVVTLLAVALYVKDQMIPDLLKDSRNEQVHSLRFDTQEAKAVVFYPKNVETEFVNSMAQYIRSDLKASHFSSENLKVDFRQFETGDTMFLCFDVVYESGKLLRTYSGICHLETHEVLQLDDLVQDSFYDFLSSEFRTAIKSSGILGDAAYTTEFYEKTNAEKMREVSFYLEDDTAYLYLETKIAGSDELLCAELKLSRLAPYFEEDELFYQAPRLVNPVSHYVDPERPMVALTFDDGPVRNNTLLALQLLNEYDAKGTFFMLGFRMERNPDVVLEVLNEGHEVASHTYNHPYLTKKSTNLTYQYSRNQEILSEITEGQAEIRLLRPPYGSFDKKVKETSPYPLIMWSLDTLDWKTLDAQATHDSIMANVQDGDIILLHDLHESSVESLKTVVPALIDAGYQLVTVSELMEARGIEMKSGVSYSKARKQTDASE